MCFPWFLIGGRARFRRELEVDFPSSNHIFREEPYRLYPLLMVEGYPGLATPDSSKFPILTLAGVSFESVSDLSAFLEESQLTQLKPIDQSETGPWTLHVVWTLRPENPEEMPPYFGIFNIFHDLMYWRGLMFGISRMSPITSLSTTQRRAQDIEQSIVFEGW